MPGLGILPVVATLTAEKRTVQSEFSFRNEISGCKGYEIHMGETERVDSQQLAILKDGMKEGCFLNEKTWRTYLHGIFDNMPVIQSILKACEKEASLHEFDFQAYKNEQYNKLAALLRQSCAIECIYRVIFSE